MFIACAQGLQLIIAITAYALVHNKFLSIIWRSHKQNTTQIKAILLCIWKSPLPRISPHIKAKIPSDEVFDSIRRSRKETKLWSHGN